MDLEKSVCNVITVLIGMVTLCYLFTLINSCAARQETFENEKVRSAIENECLVRKVPNSGWQIDCGLVLKEKSNEKEESSK